MKLNKLFDNPLVKTKITSANVKPPEMLLGYFLGPFCAFISNATFGSYLNRYYSDILGWTDVTRFGVFSALLPMVSVIFVVLGNLWVGRMIDNTRTSQGKARPYLLISAPLVILAIITLFIVPKDAAPMMQMTWIAVSYNLYYALAYPLFYTAHSSLVALSTRNSNDRGLLSTLSNASGVASVGIGASIVIPMLLNNFLFVPKAGGGIDAAASYGNWQIFMAALCVVTLLGILIEYYFSRERVTEETVKLEVKEEKISMAKQMKVCMSEPYWWMIIGYFMLFQFGGIVKNGSMTYYCTWVFEGIDAGTAQGMLGAIGGIPTAIGMVLAWPIANKLGKQKSVVIGLIISVIGGLVSFIDVNNFVIVCAGVILKGIGSIPAMYVTLAILSDVLDHLEAKNGFRSDGFTMSVYGAIMVGVTGLGSGLINALLSSAGYDANLAVQPDAVQGMLVFCYLGFELVCYAAIVTFMSFLKVEKHLEEDQKIILENQKAAVLAAGGEWIEPAERLRREQEEAERMAEEARIEDLKVMCKKKGLNFDEEEAKYQAKLAAKKAKAGKHK